MALDNKKKTRKPHNGASDLRGENDRKSIEQDIDREASEKFKERSPRRSPKKASFEDELRREEEEKFISGLKRSANQEKERKIVLKINDPLTDDKEVEEKRTVLNKKKKLKKRRILFYAIIEIITLMVIFSYATVVRYKNKMQEPDFNVQNVQNENIDVEKKKMMEGYWTVAVFGVDSRSGYLGNGTMADVQIIVNANMDTGDIQLVSVYRDSYLNVNGNKKGMHFAKINSAYSEGGPEQAVAALNNNLDLNIENYVSVNWRAVAEVITMLGGVDIDVTKSEYKQLNGYIHDVCVHTGINDKNPACEYVKGPGMQHLDGVQAVGYARLRKMDTDFKRTERQRIIIEQCLENAKKVDFATLTNIIDTVLPLVASNVDTEDIIQLAKGIRKFNIKGSQGFPLMKQLTTQMMGKKGDCVIPLSLKSNVTALHEYLYGDKGYEPSKAVADYSYRIKTDMDKYKSQAIEKKKALEEKEILKDKKDKDKKDKKDKDKDKDKKYKEETDEDGNIIIREYETDEDGNLIKKPSKKNDKKEYETDEDGNLIKKELETDEDGNIIREELETDEDGNIIRKDNDKKPSKDKDKHKQYMVDPEGYVIKGVDDSGSPIYLKDKNGKKIYYKDFLDNEKDKNKDKNKDKDKVRPGEDEDNDREERYPGDDRESDKNKKPSKDKDKNKKPTDDVFIPGMNDEDDGPRHPGDEYDGSHNSRPGDDIDEAAGPGSSNKKKDESKGPSHSKDKNESKGPGHSKDKNESKGPGNSKDKPSAPSDRIDEAKGPSNSNTPSKSSNKGPGGVSAEIDEIETIPMF